MHESPKTYRLYIWHRYCSPKAGGLITNESHGDDTWLLAGTAEYLRDYAATGLKEQATKPNDSDRVRLERLYTEILELHDTADMRYYESPART